MVQDWRTGVASVLDWWGDAGVDTLLEDDPRDWLARPAPTPSSIAEEPIEIPAEVLPDTLDAFIAWRMSDSSPEFEWFSPRIAPSGNPGAALMVLTDMPETEDGESLLTGAAGRLFDKMLAALGENRDSIYLVSLATARPLAGRIPPEQEDRLVQLARHHIGLAAPKKLLLLGQATDRVRATTNGSASSNGEAVINDFDRIMDTSKVVAIRHPRFMLERAKEKAAAWKQLIEFNRGDRP